MSMLRLFSRAACKATLLFVAVVLVGPSTAAAQGRIDCSSIPSKILKRSVRYCTLLPTSYEAETGKKYPIVYFLHGLGENEQALALGGGWGEIQDLRRRNAIGDFVIVAVEGGATFFINSADGHDRYSDFFLTEFIPYIESHFRVIRNRGSRGITGLSMGGYGALRFAFAHPELFGSVSVQSAALITQSPKELNADLQRAGPLGRVLGTAFGNPINTAHWNQNNPFVLARQNRAQIRNVAIYINCGEQDDFGFNEGASKLHQQLVAEGLRHEFHLYPGRHTPDYFLSHLGETLKFHSDVFAKAAPVGAAR
jgi:S-formylglutathione hydrolase FrmB